jgi:carbamate kinase
MRIVVALGGNALLHRGEAPDAEPQRRNVDHAVRALAPLVADHDLVITHGNGPQIGVLAMESAADPLLATPYPLSVLGAQTQGLIGLWLVQSITNRIPDRRVVALVTRCVVDGGDPAFDDPTKFVGPVYGQAEARQLATAGGWTVKPDGLKWRRVVASPVPQRIVEAHVIRLLVDAGVLVVCAGGGGVPVVEVADGTLACVEGVIDKDLSSALLAEELGADMLALLTDVPFVETAFGMPGSRPLHDVTVSELRSYSFAAGSMGPKVEAVCRFVERTRGVAVIGALDDAAEVVAGEAGTRVRLS